MQISWVNAMLRYKIYINETVQFKHDMTIDVPINSNVDHILDAAQDYSHIDDVKQCLLDNDCKIISFSKDESGDDAEIEIDDISRIEECNIWEK